MPQATCGKIGGKHRILLLIFIVNLDSFVMGPLTNYNNKDCHIQCVTHSVKYLRKGHSLINNRTKSKSFSNGLFLVLRTDLLCVSGLIMAGK